MSTSESEQRQHYKVTFAVILVAVSTYAMLQSLVSPVLPTIQHSLHTTQNTVTWVLTAYLLAASVATPISWVIHFANVTSSSSVRPEMSAKM